VTGVAAGGGEQGPAHVLVVDDDLRLRELLQRYLVNQGYLVTAAADVEEARGRLRNLAFDIVVLDVMLPGQDGISFTAELRRDGDVPVLLLTARGEPEDRIGGLEAGADDYLVKPFEPKELLLRIATILRRAQATRTDDTVRFGPFAFNRTLGRAAPRRRDRPPHHRRGGAPPGAGEEAGPGGEPRRAGRAGPGRRLGPRGRRADGPAAAQDRGGPAPAALPADRARLGLHAAAGELSAT
jgi:CheY-like chemotaxis protein